MPLDLRRWLGITPHPDGQASALEAEAPTTEAFAPVPHRRTLPRPDTIIQAALAQKLLHGWMQNRYQTRYPLVLNLRNNTPEEAALLLEAVQAALATADPTPAARTHAEAALATLGATLPPTSPNTSALPTLIDRLHQARLAAQAYAACAATLRRTPTTRRYLDFLAARLVLPDDTARSLNRRFGA